MKQFDEQFDAMGARIRIVIEEPGEPGLAAPHEAGRVARDFIRDFDRRLSRFKPDSELAAMNRDPGTEIPASGLLRTAVKAGLWAARQSGGLVDPTLVDEIEAAGYRESRAGMSGVPAPEALADAPDRQSAAPGGSRRWEGFRIDDRREVIHRPRGLKFDTGGTGKGLAADLVAESLEGYSRYLISCGGDIRVGGREAGRLPYDVSVEHPVSGRRPHLFRLGTGGVATSGINVRAWRTAEGQVAHHLLDPSTGEPCWSGLVGATALGRTALEAETLAKAALLSGPDGGRRILSQHGGLIVHESNRVELVGPNRVSFRIPEIRTIESGAAA